MCREVGIGKRVPVLTTTCMTEQTNEFRFTWTKKAYASLTDVLLFHKWCNYWQYQQGCHFQVNLFISAVKRDKYNKIFVWAIMHRQRIS